MGIKQIVILVILVFFIIESGIAFYIAGQEPTFDPVVPEETDVPSEDRGEVQHLVWVSTNGGVKYHITSTCSQMKDPQQMTEQMAIAKGFTPCKKCYRP